jgi:predicted RNase H-like nuclease (RuvC/YqgF family)
MAEGLGLAASVIAVIDLSVKVATLCSKYYTNVKNARGDIEHLQSEAQRLKETLEQVQSLCNSPNGAKLRESQSLRDRVEDSKVQLAQLKTKLESKNSQKAMRRFGRRALKWPFMSNEIDGIMKALGDCKDSISFILQVDEM